MPRKLSTGCAHPPPNCRRGQALWAHDWGHEREQYVGHAAHTGHAGLGEALPGAAGVAARLGGGRAGPRAVRVERDGDVRAVRLGQGDGRAAAGHGPAERHDGRRALPGRRLDLVVRRQGRRRVRRLAPPALHGRPGRAGRARPRPVLPGRPGPVPRRPHGGRRPLHGRGGYDDPPGPRGHGPGGDLPPPRVGGRRRPLARRLPDRRRAHRARRRHARGPAGAPPGRHDGRRAGRHQGRHRGAGPGGAGLRPGRRRHPAAHRAPAPGPLGTAGVGRGHGRGDRPGPGPAR